MNGDKTPPTDGRVPSHDGDVATMVAFLNALFEPGDAFTLRPVETWTEDNRRRSRVDYKGIVCLKITEDVKTSHLHNICDSRIRRSVQEKTNTFFGVCPRFDERGKYEKAWQIRTVRALWADIDHATVEDVVTRIIAAGLPRPSLIISSGNGVHVYWLLAEPYLIDDAGDPPPVQSQWVEIQGKNKRIEYFVDAHGERVNLHDPKSGNPLKRNEPALSPKAVHIQDMLQGIAAAIGGDHTFDLARLLRVPGTLNRKDERNGKPPRPCEMVENNGERYSIDLFEKFAESSPGRAEHAKIAGKATTASSTTNRASSNGGWVRVSKHYLCPICHKPDNCQVSEDGQVVWCGRISEGSTRQNNGGQYLHWLDPQSPGFRPPPKKQTSSAPATRDWSAFSLQLSQHAATARRQLAEQLGVSLNSLEQLGVGWSEDNGYWSFPERNGDGEIIGISARYRSGEKKRLSGGQAGLTYSDDWDTGVGPILLVEGGSDTAALLTLGLTVVGRPSNNGGVDLLLDLLEHVPPDREIIVIGERDEKADGSWPGKEGAVRTATGLAEELERPVAWSLPPDNAKDTRAWLQSVAAVPIDRRSDLFLSGLDPALIRPPLTLPPVEVIGPIVEIGDWREQMLAARVRSLKYPGIYLDASGTGAGKSRVDFETILHLCGKGSAV